MIDNDWIYKILNAKKKKDGVNFIAHEFQKLVSRPTFKIMRVNWRNEFIKTVIILYKR